MRTATWPGTLSRRTWLILIGLMLLALAIPRQTAGETGMVIEGFVSEGLFLYDLPSNNGYPVTGQPTPNRIHVRYSEEFSDWVFVLSDSYGRFATPLEVLVSGSVVEGPLIGGLPGERYEFAAGGGWVRTSEPEKLRFVVLDEVPRLKVVSYEPIESHTVEFVNPRYDLDFKVYDPLARR